MAAKETKLTPYQRELALRRELAELRKELQSKTTIKLPNFGLGIMRTSTTYAALIIQLEGGRWDQLAVLDSVMEALEIHPEEVTLYRSRPDCVHEEKRAAWEEEYKALLKKLGVKE